MTLVGLDVGQSGVRALLRGDGPDRRLEAAGAAEPLAVIGAPGRVGERIADVIGALAAGTRLRSVAIGLSGFDTPGDDVREVARTVARQTGADRITITTDVVTWHLAVHGEGAGVVAAAGTGSVALASDGAGRWARADGWGHLLGDEGSGFAIGRAGLMSALAAMDGRGGSTALLERAVARFGPGPGIAAAVHRSTSPVLTVASFARDVADAALAADAASCAIWDAAGRALGRSVIAAWRTVFPQRTSVAVGLVGSLVRAGPLVLEPCSAELAAHGLAPVVVDADPLDGAVLLAGGSGRLFPGLVVEVVGTADA